MSPFKITVEEVLTLEAYLQKRTEIRKEMILLKDKSRINVGPNMSFLFENKQTLLYQIHEMIRVEELVEPENVQHEIDTYNKLMPGPNSITATMMLEFPEEDERRYKLRILKDITRCIFLNVDDQKVPAQFDKGQQDEERASAVQFLKFKINRLLKPKSVKITINHEAYKHETCLNEPQITMFWETP